MNDPKYVPVQGERLHFDIVYDGLTPYRVGQLELYETWRIELMHHGKESDINSRFYRFPNGWGNEPGGTIWPTLIAALQSGLEGLLEYCRLDDIA